MWILAVNVMAIEFRLLPVPSPSSTVSKSVLLNLLSAQYVVSKSVVYIEFCFCASLPALRAFLGLPQCHAVICAVSASVPVHCESFRAQLQG